MNNELDRLRKLWDDAYRAFKGAFDTPLAWRNDQSEFAEDARKRMSNFNDELAVTLDAPLRATPATDSPPRPMGEAAPGLPDPDNAAYIFEGLSRRRHEDLAWLAEHPAEMETPTADEELQAYREMHFRLDTLLGDRLAVTQEGDFAAAINNTLASIASAMAAGKDGEK